MRGHTHGEPSSNAFFGEKIPDTKLVLQTSYINDRDPPPFRGAPIIVHTVLIAFSRANRRSKFKKRSQQFIRTHNKPLSVAAMCVHHARSIHYQS